MPTTLDFPTKGRVIRVADGQIVFAPSGTSYELYLTGTYTGETNTLIHGIIRARARKVYTVPSGGNFTSPIQGPPRQIQGWVLYADEKNLVVHAGPNFNIALPQDDASIDLGEGQIAVNKLVNVMLLPECTFEVVSSGH
ncbi:MAG TPA: hypothetical protein VF669_14080 [Tepidisphaeraceae bacterium]|jgi:hypothetical protein